MLNYANLNDLEFEALCRDIMERKLGLPLHRFAPGKDGGIDLTDDAARRDLLIQVRHYQKSDTAALIRSLKAELPKVRRHAPKAYYICCSRELSCDRIRELFCHFRPYMASPSHILTLLEIDDFLKQPENADILKKHFKLWLDSTGILEDLCNDSLFADCEVFLSDIDYLYKRFVPTSAFSAALACLKQHPVLCILGDPGAGKSVTSKMLALTYAAQGWRVRYTTDVANLTALKASLRRDPQSKEIIVLDDCFGQAYFDMKASQCPELLSLIQFVRLHPRKRLILNTRLTIYQEASRRHQPLIRALELGEYQVHQLDMGNLSPEEKAKILYNHLHFNQVPQSYLDNLRQNCRYLEIITHPNFTPRIIDFVCTPSHYSRVAPDGFSDYILSQLDNPQDIWKDEYENRLSKTDRILLQTVYSLSGSHVDEKTVRACFHRRIAEDPTVDKTVDPFPASLARLCDSFLSLWRPAKVTFLSLRNPSIADFLRARLEESDLEWKEMVFHIYTVEQMRLLPVSWYIPYTSVILETGAIRLFFFPSEFRRILFIGWGVLAAKLCMEEYREEFLHYLLMGILSPFPWPLTAKDQNEMLSHLLSPEIWSFYGLADYLCREDHLESLLHRLDLETASAFLQKMEPLIPAASHSSFRQQSQNLLRSIADGQRLTAFFPDAPDPFVDLCDYESLQKDTLAQWETVFNLFQSE